jgi:uncharacterized protein involved in outer membrane biogenesis
MASKRFGRIAIIALASIVTLILVAYAVLLSLDLNRFKPVIVQAVKEASGLDVVLHGDIKIKLGFTLKAVLNQVDVRNAAWGSRPETAILKRCELSLALSRLIRGFIEIDRLVFIEPDVFLETNASGEINVPVKDIHRRKHPSGMTSDRVPILPVREVQVIRGHLAYKNDLSGKIYSLDVERLTLTASGVRSQVRTELLGLLNGRPFEVEGTLGSPAALIDSNDPWTVNLTAKAEDAVASIQGTIKNVAKLKGISLKTHAEGPSISRTLALAGIGLAQDLGPFSLDATLSDPEGELSLAPISLLVGSDKIALVQINGTMANLLARRGIHLRFTTQCKDLSRLSRFSPKPLPLRGSLIPSGTIIDPAPGTFGVPDLRLSLGDKDITGSVRLDLTNEFPRSTIMLACRDLDLGKVLAPGLGKSTWVHVLKRMGLVDLALSVADPYGRPVVEELVFRAGDREKGTLTIKGAIKDLLSLTGIGADVNFQGKDAAALEKIFGKPVPVRGPFAVSGHIEDPSQKVLSCDDFEVRLGENEVTGLLELNMAAKKPRLDAALSLQKLDLEPVLRAGMVDSKFLRTLPSLAPVTLTISVSDPSGKPVVQKLKARVGTDDLAALELKGSLQDLLAQQGIRLDLTVWGREATRLEKIFGRPIPVRGPFSLSGEIVDKGAGEYRMKNFLAKLGGNEVQGRVALSLGKAPLRITAEVSSQNLDLSMVDGMEKIRGKLLHALGPWTLALSLLNEGGKLAVPNARLRLEVRNTAEAKISGAIQDLIAWQGVDLKFSIRGADLASLEKLTGNPVRLGGAFTLSGRLVDPKAGIYRVREFHGLLGDNDIDGSLELDLTGKRTHLYADFSSKSLDLRPLLAKAKPNPGKNSEHGAPGKKDTRVLPTEPFHLEYIHLMNGAIKWRADRVLLPRLMVEKVTTDISLEDGHLQLDPFQCAVGGGTVQGRFDLQSRIGKANTDLNLKASRVDLGTVSAQLGLRKFLEGTLGANIKVKGEGGSIAELVGGLNGTVSLAEREGRVHTSEIDFLGSSLFSKIIRLINPFSQKEEYSELYCNVQHFEIKKGLAACKTWLADTKYTTVRGGGEIDLRNEKWDLLFALSPTKSGIGIKGVAGFDLPSFTDSFEVKGTFAHPSISLNPSGAVEAIGKMVGGFALLGPVGLAAGLIDLNGGKESLCREVMDAVENGQDIPGEAENHTPSGAYSRPFPPANDNGGY